ncbi:hypothetical protein Pmani_003681 [Petrolisthes manimaculis]|uniref:Uncharacterized protein n=1 Tax=Petrolisthes manimaculis TaxID=1843537 RepID=A0AAE1QI19_9EUCA|nr:hypothetical protein Pmani_003681 [Petrolisthes manimaculis]
MHVKLGLEAIWRNPTLGTSLAILRQRTISLERPLLEPLPALDSETGGGRRPSVFLLPYSSSRTSLLRFLQRQKGQKGEEEKKGPGQFFIPQSSEKEIPLLHPESFDGGSLLPLWKLEAKFPDNFPPSRSSFNQSGIHTLLDDPGFLDSRPASPDPPLPSASAQNQASASDPQPSTSSAPASALTTVMTPALDQASQLNRTSPVPSTSATPP